VILYIIIGICIGVIITAIIMVLRRLIELEATLKTRDITIKTLRKELAYYKVNVEVTE